MEKKMQAMTPTAAQKAANSELDMKNTAMGIMRYVHTYAQQQQKR
jgi:hypothetical protein